MKIYLIRHGIAEDYAKDDFHRNLTPEGRIKLNRRFRSFATSLSLKESYKIYSSPLLRGVETAKILCQNLHRSYEVMDFLAGCPTEELMKRLDSHENYILIGHQPHLSQHIYDLTGEFVPVSRGSIHLVEIEEDQRKYKKI